MEIYKQATPSIVLSNQVFYADEDGIINVPDEMIDSSVWTNGFVSAASHRKAIDAAKQSTPTAVEAQETKPSKTATKE